MTDAHLEVRTGLPVLAFASAAEWEQWLRKQPRSSKGLWVKLAKKESGIASVSRREAIDGALCHGWIDGQLQPYDEQYWLVRFTPRSAKSKWSKINSTRAQELIELGRMSAAGLAEVERAKSDGRWEVAYPSQSKAEVPEDLQAALDANPKAQRLFSQLDSANRYAILYRLHEARKPETRCERIAKFVAMLARGETLHPRKISSKTGGKRAP